jgi:hypothetical protein
LGKASAFIRWLPPAEPFAELRVEPATARGSSIGATGQNQRRRQMKNDAKDLEIIENRKRFVHELRTTQKAQARGSFRTLDGKYCALGLYEYEGHCGFSTFELSTLMMWNDSGSSFAEIADRIEENNFSLYTDIRPINLKPHSRLSQKANLQIPDNEVLLDRYRQTLAKGRLRKEKEVAKITLEQWFERYGGDPQALEHSA